jgi:RNA polymerase sigma-70 factor (ECF subfamily)
VVDDVQPAVNTPLGRADRWAEFGDHYREDAPRLVAFALAVGADRVRAAEIAQESMLSLWQRWGALPGSPRLVGRRAAVRAGERAGEAGPAAEPLRTSVAQAHGAVLAGLARLPLAQRRVLVATLDDLPAAEVAHLLEIRPETVAPTAVAARAALEKLLGGRAARQAYAALVDDVAAELDVEAGLALVAAAAPDAPVVPLRSGSERESSEVPDELVAAAMAGDREAVARLLETIRPLVVRYCRGRLGVTDRSSLSADDVAQEVCMAVLTALPSYRVQGKPFLAFVYGIASHKVIDAHRAVSRGRSEPVPEVPDRIEVTAGPEQRALQGELTGRLREMLDTLPDKQREILVLRIVVGLSAEETAQMVGASPGAVRVAQHRALNRLRKELPPDLGGDA